ncbi:MAG: hypothetical protein P9L99_11465 [Candidatus Lernaella stagnicola]|nr:hypothetical protein [Candidatus Lernaella stagnicola]
MKTRIGGCVVGLLLLVVAAAVWAGPKPRAGWMVICGTFDDTPAAWRLRDKVDAQIEKPARVIETDEYENLTPGLKIISAGLYSAKKKAASVSEKLGANGVKCYVKKTALKQSPAGRIIYVGDQDTMWFCFRHRGAALAYNTCAQRIGKGDRLLRPHIAKSKGSYGYQTVRVMRANEFGDDSPCEDLVGYSGSVGETKKLGQALKGKKARAEAIAAFREFAEKKSKLKFSRLRLSAAVKVDVTGDGVADTVIGIGAGIGQPQMKVIGNVVSAVAVIPGGESTKRVIPLFWHAVPHEKAQGDFYTASIYGRLAGFADVNGDGRIDVLVETGYYEGTGLIAYTIEKGKAKEMASNGCGA